MVHFLSLFFFKPKGNFLLFGSISTSFIRLLLPNIYIKGDCSDPQPNHSFSKTYAGFGTRGWAIILEGFMWKVTCAVCVLYEKVSEKISWKEKVVTTIYKTINISIVFSNCMQMTYTFASWSSFGIPYHNRFSMGKNGPYTCTVMEGNGRVF